MHPREDEHWYEVIANSINDSNHGNIFPLSPEVMLPNCLMPLGAKICDVT
jgi:hypothetical protein